MFARMNNPQIVMSSKSSGVFVLNPQEAEREAQRQRQKGAMKVRIVKSNIKLSRVKDTDNDGIKDAQDSQPFNPRRQGFLHDLQIKVLKKREEILETKRQKAMDKFEDTKEILTQRRAVTAKSTEIKKAKLQAKQAIIDEISKERKEILDLKEANKKAQLELDRSTLLGRITLGTIKASKAVIEASAKRLKEPRTKPRKKVKKEKAFAFGDF